MRKKINISRRPVEIYFVLYLAALIFLIPKPGENEQKTSNGKTSSMELPFSIRPEKSVLFCRMILDSVPAIIHLDSINTIFHTGEIENLKYEFFVEDQIYKQKIKLSSDLEQNNRFFFVSENRNDQTASFRWLPPLDEKMNKSYIVYVNASGNSKGSDNQITARTQFTLVINFYDKETGLPTVQQELPVIVDNSNNNSTVDLQGEIRPNLSDFNLSMRSDIVETIAFQDWENQLFIIGGLNPINDLLKNPDIKITHSPENNGGSVYIANYFSNGIVLKGKSPAFGSINITITLKRRYDNKEASISFRVSALPIGSPEIALEMYPGVAYSIKPKLPQIAGQDVKAYLKEGEKVRATSSTGDAFSFTPQLADTGKVLSFERYINGNLIGQKYRVAVKNYPPPAIVKLSKTGSQTVLVQTIGYGYHNSRENTVASLEITGNGTFNKELFGQYKEDKSASVWTQFFEIVPKDASKPFLFKVRAKDRRGELSEIEEFK